MSTQVTKTNLPTLDQLVSDTELSIKDNQLTILLNQQPPAKWLRPHPTAKAKDENGQTIPAMYLPIDKVEFMLTKIYPKWWVEVLNTQIIANSVCVTVRVFVLNPITNEIEHQDGVGAKSIQTDSGKGAMDWNYAKDAGVMMALPSAKTYAIKDAVEHFGRIFGRDLNRQNQLSYDSLLKKLNSTEASQQLEHERIINFINNARTITQLNEVAKLLTNDEQREAYKTQFNTIKLYNHEV